MAILTTDGLSVSSALAFGALRPPSPYTPPPAGPVGDVTVQLFDATLTPRMPITFYSLSATLYYNAVSSWSMTIPYSQNLWNAVKAGDVLIEVDWRGMFKFGGKVEQPAYQDSIPGARSGGAPLAGPFMVLSGADWMALIANRIAYPDPTKTWPNQAKNVMDVLTNAPVEDGVKAFIDQNMGLGTIGAGPGAIAARRMPYFDIANSLGRGGLVSYTVKFAASVNLNLLDLCRTLIAAGSGTTGMGMSIQRNGKRLLFDVYIPRDLSKKAWFSKDLGNLTAINLYLTDPTCTNACVNGAGALSVEKVAASTTVWNRSEQYVDQSTETDVNNVNAAAQITLASGGFGPLLNATITDSPFLTFGRDYYLGDIVTVEVTPGNIYSDVITSVDLVCNPGQDPVYSITPKLGRSADATTTDQAIIGQLSARIRALEKKLNMT
jgi:hypothetical protein